MRAPRALVVAGTPGGRSVIGDVIRARGAAVIGACDVADATARMELGQFDVVTVARSSVREAMRFAASLRSAGSLAAVLPHADETVGSVEREVIPFLPWAGSRPGLAAASRPGLAAASRVEVVALGASTGGPVAITALLGSVRGRLGVPLLLVQHMPVGFTAPFAARLSSECGLVVREAETGVIPGPGEAWLAPADHHMEVRRAAGSLELLLHRGPPENSCRPAVDVLFRSVAATCGPRAIGVVLTGMGHDGLAGARLLVEQRATVFVQDEASSVIWGMPGSIARAGLATRVLPLGDIAGELLARTPAVGVAR